MFILETISNITSPSLGQGNNKPVRNNNPSATPSEAKAPDITPEKQAASSKKPAPPPIYLSQAELISKQAEKMLSFFPKLAVPYVDSLYQFGKQSINDATLSNKQKETLKQSPSTYAMTQGMRNYSLDEVGKWIDKNYDVIA